MSDIKKILKLINAYFEYHKNKPKGTIHNGTFQRHPIWGHIAELQRNGVYDYAIAIWQDNQKNLPEPPNATNNPDSDMLNLQKWAIAISGGGSNITATEQTKEKSRESEAISTLLNHPGWTNKEIAKYIGIHPKSISRYDKIKLAREAMRSGLELPTGEKDENGNLKAW